MRDRRLARRRSRGAGHGRELYRFLSAATATVDRTSFTQNHASCRRRRAVRAGGTLTVRDSTFTTNTAWDNGGGIWAKGDARGGSLHLHGQRRLVRQRRRDLRRGIKGRIDPRLDVRERERWIRRRRDLHALEPARHDRHVLVPVDAAPLVAQVKPVAVDAQRVDRRALEFRTG